MTTFFVAESRWSRLYNGHAVAADKPVDIFLRERVNLDKLTDLLADSSLIRDPEEFRWAAQLLGWNRFREGHYRVDHDFSYQQFLSKLARGIQDPVSVTILPGKSKKQIVASVSRQMQFDSLAFHRAITDSSFLATLNVDTEDVIGRLYPNTYSAYWTASPQSFFKRILREFDRAVVSAHRQRLNEIKYSVDEIVTLASIIEWEAESDSEKATISGLYWNRLDRGMRLQADPTVNFAIGERRRLLYEDYRVQHPYNTYIHRGLPPGPITNPSLSSITAALYPEDNDYLYMVASPDGSHAFSETFAEHKRKSKKWRQWIQKQYRLKRQQENNQE